MRLLLALLLITFTTVAWGGCDLDALTAEYEEARKASKAAPEDQKSQMALGEIHASLRKEDCYYATYRGTVMRAMPVAKKDQKDED